jgi:uncharacterized OB-fold protein
MVRCDRCGTAFSPIEAAVLGYCPQCKARDGALVALIRKVVKDPPGPGLDEAAS